MLKEERERCRGVEIAKASLSTFSVSSSSPIGTKVTHPIHAYSAHFTLDLRALEPGRRFAVIPQQSDRHFFGWAACEADMPARMCGESKLVSDVYSEAESGKERVEGRASRVVKQERRGAVREDQRLGDAADCAAERSVSRTMRRTRGRERLSGPVVVVGMQARATTRAWPCESRSSASLSSQNAAF